MKRRILRFGNGVCGLLGDNRGSTAIEFAICAPIMLIMILGMIEISLNMFVDASVQMAAQAASRAGLTTSLPASGTRAQQAQTIVNNILAGWKNIGATWTVTELTYGTYGNVSNPSYIPPAGPGGLGDVVSYNISLTMPEKGFSGIPKLLGIKPLVFQRNYLVQDEQ